jgi:hypothetical protein
MGIESIFQLPPMNRVFASILKVLQFSMKLGSVICIHASPLDIDDNSFILIYSHMEVYTS